MANLLRYKQPGFKRRCHKWAMCAYKGGKCISCCERVTAGNIASFHFDHKAQVNNHNDKTDRWGGAICDLPPFTQRWFFWAETVDLICVGCHQNKHKPVQPQLTLDLDAHKRLDGYTAGPVPTTQMPLFEMT